ncbi:hypothetical protein [Halpernia sp. GG3]
MKFDTASTISPIEFGIDENFIIFRNLEGFCSSLWNCLYPEERYDLFSFQRKSSV